MTNIDNIYYLRVYHNQFKHIIQLHRQQLLILMNKCKQNQLHLLKRRYIKTDNLMIITKTYLINDKTASFVYTTLYIAINIIYLYIQLFA